MEIKKTQKADLENKKGLFLEIGLVLSIALMIGMFSVSQSEVVFEQTTTGNIAVEEEIVDITVQEQKPIEPPKQQTVAVTTDIMRIVKDDTQITTEFDFSSEFNEDAIIVPPAPVATEEVIEDDAPFMRAEVMPSFQGKDERAFCDWVQARLVYPRIALENGISGRVTVKFIIERDGTVKVDQVIASPDQSLSDEAVKVISSSPKWTPGQQRGSAVRVFFVLPFEFQLTSLK